VRIVGDYGVGKTAIIAEMAQNADNPLNHFVMAWHCCQHNLPDTLKAAWMVGNLAAQLAEHLPDFRERLSDPVVSEALRRREEPGQAYAALVKGVLEPLRQIGPPTTAEDTGRTSGIRFLLIDALDESVDRASSTGISEIATLLGDAARILPDWLRLIVTTRPDDVIDQSLGGLQPYTIDAEAELSRDDLRDCLCERLGSTDFQSRLTKSGMTAEALVETLVEKSEGRFLYLVRVLEAVHQGQLTLAELDRLPPGMESLYGAFFERLFPGRDDYERVLPVVELLVAAREPLSRDHLLACLGKKEKKRRVVDSALSALSQFLRQRRSGFEDEPSRSVGREFNHKSLYDWLGRPGTTFYANPGAGHRRLAKMCRRELRRGPESLSGYLLRHFPNHLIEAERLDELAELLLNWRFLEGKAEARLVFELVTDFARARQSLPRRHLASEMLRLIEKALRTEANFLEENPDTLFQTLWNRCWWYDASAAAEHYIEPGGGWTEHNAPWLADAPRLSSWLDDWQAGKQSAASGFCWFRSTRPPEMDLGSAQIAVLAGHTKMVRSVAVLSTPEGLRVVSGSFDNTVRVWDGESGQELQRLDGHTDWVSSVAVQSTPEGLRVVSGSFDNTVRVWDGESGQELQRLAGHTDLVWSVAVQSTPEGLRVVSGSFDNTVRVWDGESGQELQRLEGRTGGCAAWRCSPRLRACAW
jgi:hypothetical protein